MATPIEMPMLAPRPNALYLTIRIQDNCGRLDHDSVRVSRRRGEGICWKSQADTDVVIEFNKPGGSPFSVSRIHVPAGECGYSGAATAPDGEYHYTVIGSEGSNDPDVVVEN